MTFYVHVQEEQSNRFFNSEVEAESLDHAVEEVTRQLLEGYLTVPPKIQIGKLERVLITISSSRDTVPEGTWRLTLKEKVPTPCGQCGGAGGVDSGGVTPHGTGIDIPCPSCVDEAVKSTTTVYEANDGND